jgi:hypothetical protein
MLYLISGTSRSGKTIIAKKILESKKIPYLSLDWLVMGFTNGLPQYGIHDKLFPNEIAEKFWTFLKAMCDNMLWEDLDYVIEGEAILPELISELLIKYPDKIKICFVGYTNIDVEEKVKSVKEFSIGMNDWLTNESNEYIHDHINNMVTYSRGIKVDCEKNNICYFDTSEDFIGTIDKAVEYLLEKT